MEACSVKAGINYLGQALHPNAVALPAPHGVSVARRSAGVPPQEIISKLEISGGQAVMLSAIAWCPVAPELLALAIDLERSVQLWRLQGELLSGSKVHHAQHAERAQALTPSPTPTLTPTTTLTLTLTLIPILT